MQLQQLSQRYNQHERELQASGKATLCQHQTAYPSHWYYRCSAGDLTNNQNLPDKYQKMGQVLQAAEQQEILDVYIGTVTCEDHCASQFGEAEVQDSITSVSNWRTLDGVHPGWPPDVMDVFGNDSVLQVDVASTGCICCCLHLLPLLQHYVAQCMASLGAQHDKSLSRYQVRVAECLELSHLTAHQKLHSLLPCNMLLTNTFRGVLQTPE